MREEQQAAMDRDRTRDQDRHQRHASAPATAHTSTQQFYEPRSQPAPQYDNAYPHPQVYTAYNSSSATVVAADSPQGPLRVSEQLGGGSSHRYQMSTSLDMTSPQRPPHATQVQAGRSNVYSPDRDVGTSERVESRGGFKGVIPEDNEREKERRNEADKERDRLMDLAVTERIERERVTRESENKTAAAAAEMSKLKKEMERQRIEMEERELKWEADRERKVREDRMEAEKKEMQESSERHAEEERRRVNDEADRREKDMEMEREVEIRKEKERRTAKENEAAQAERERCRTIEEEREKEIKEKEKVRLLAEEKIAEDKASAEAVAESNRSETVREDEEEEKKAEKDVEMDSQVAKEAVLSELKERQNKVEQSEGNSSDADLGPVPTSIPWKQKQDSRDSVDFRASETFRDSLDYPRKSTFQPMNSNMHRESMESEIQTPRMSTEWVSTIEHADEDDVSQLGPYQNGPGFSQKDPMSGVKRREDGERSMDSDAWLEDRSASLAREESVVGLDGEEDGEEDEEGEGEEENDILIQQYDGQSTQELLSSQFKLPESADTVDERDTYKKGDEGDDLSVRESEDDRLARQRASVEMEKKEADDKAIQEARASVIARRKQKLERDSAAASLSSLPSEKVDRGRSSLLASSLPSMGASKMEQYSSSDESHGPVQLDKSKSVMGVSDLSYILISPRLILSCLSFWSTLGTYICEFLQFLFLIIMFDDVWYLYIEYHSILCHLFIFMPIHHNTTMQGQPNSSSFSLFTSYTKKALK